MARRLTAEPDATSGSRPPAPAAEPPGWFRCLWRAPIGAHGVALAVVLVALVPLVGPGASFSADEGAAIVQARHLARGQGWIVDHPVPQADPTGRNYPLELSTRGPRGVAPFAKHPLYALMLAAADRVGGVPAMVLLSVAGTVAAAALAAALARRLDPALARPALWVVGVASPLFFDGYLVIAHTLGAAAAGGAVICALWAVEGRRPVPALAGVAACVAAAVLLRNEAVFVALGLAVAAAALAVGRRSRSRPVAAVAVVAVSAAALAHLGEQAWVRDVVGGTPYPNASMGGSGGLSGRFLSFTLTWLRPGYAHSGFVAVALGVMAVALAMGSLAALRRPPDGRVVIGASVVAASAAIVAVLVRPTNVVPGLLVAFPLLGLGLVAVRRETVRSPAGRVAMGTFTVFAVAVLATQYEVGGSGEWGGRYFAIGLPLVVPVALLAIRDAGRRMRPDVRRWAVGGLTACSVLMAVMAIGSLRHNHRNIASLVSRVSRVERAVDASGLERPVLVTTEGLLPRKAWTTFDRQRWLLADPSGLPDLVRRLDAAGERQVILVSAHWRRDLEALGARVQVVSRTGVSRAGWWQVVVLRTGS